MTAGPPLPPSFWLLWTAQGLSQFGSFVQWVALPLWVVGVTGSPVAAGLAFALETLPVVLLAPWAGYLVDRLDRRNLIVVGEACSAATVGLILIGVGRSQVAVVFAGMLLIRVLNTTSMPAAQAIVRVTVGTALPRATAMLQALAGAMITLGPIAGAALFAGYGIEIVLYINLASFVGSAAVTAFVGRSPGQGVSGGVTSASVEALRGIIRSRRLAPVAAIEVAYFLFFGGVLPLCLLLARDGMGDRFAGLYPGGMGAGWLLASLLVVRRYGARSHRIVLIGSLGCLPLGALLWVLVGLHPVASFLVGVLAGALNVMVAAGATVVYQTETPAAATGRVFALRRAVTNGCLALSYVAVPMLGTVSRPGLAVAVAGGLTAASVLIVLAAARHAPAEPRDPEMTVMAR